MTASEPASFPTAMRRAGWVLASLMALYPIDAFVEERAMRQLIAAERAAHPPQPASSGMQFELRTSTIHCGPLGWLGSWAFILGAVWVLVAGSLWLHYRLTARRLDTASRRAFAAVSIVVTTVLGV